ncbi:Sec-independent protein translocase protein TatB [Shimia sp. SDUM112013]|uniref:Sec-independent protein translocase protein TatB n=1 Tax=Shimia sp. SDUM112013 TaxID=3136160 RepID=UPI0032EAD34F
MAELLVIGIVALIVVGPKDLPVLFRRVGQFVGKAKGMAREFSSAMNQAADQAGIKDVTDSLKNASDGLNTVSNPMKAATETFKTTTKSMVDIDPDSETGKLAAKRAEDSKKVKEAMTKKAQDRLEAEAKAAEEAAAAARARAEAAKAATPETPEKDKA